MSILDAIRFTKKHRKFRLMSFDELISSSISCTTFIDKSTVEDGTVKCYRNNGVTLKFNEHEKFNVYMVYTDEYRELLEKAKSFIDRGFVDNEEDGFKVLKTFFNKYVYK